MELELEGEASVRPHQLQLDGVRQVLIARHPISASGNNLANSASSHSIRANENSATDLLFNFCCCLISKMSSAITWRFLVRGGALWIDFMILIIFCDIRHFIPMWQETAQKADKLISCPVDTSSNLVECISTQRLSWQRRHRDVKLWLKSIKKAIFFGWMDAA